MGNENEGVIQEPQVLQCFKDALAIGMRVLKVSCGENHTLALVEMPVSTDDDSTSQIK